MATHLARARLSYGEWLRRENRRIDARNQLRPALEALISMGTQAWAERGQVRVCGHRREVRKRTEDTRDDLTPQEEEIAQLARDGRTPGDRRPAVHRDPHRGVAPAQGVRKLDISSRRELETALSRRRARRDGWRWSNGLPDAGPDPAPPGTRCGMDRRPGHPARARRLVIEAAYSL